VADRAPLVEGANAAGSGSGAFCIIDTRDGAFKVVFSGAAREFVFAAAVAAPFFFLLAIPRVELLDFGLDVVEAVDPLRALLVLPFPFLVDCLAGDTGIGTSPL
jgi:hypothetical protein